MFDRISHMEPYFQKRKSCPDLAMNVYKESESWWSIKSIQKGFQTGILTAIIKSY